MSKVFSLKLSLQEDIEVVEKSYKMQGFKNVNNYLKYLVDENIRSVNNNNNNKNEQIQIAKNMIDKLSVSDIEKVIDYIKLLLK